MKNKINALTKLVHWQQLVNRQNKFVCDTQGRNIVSRRGGGKQFSSKNFSQEIAKMRIYPKKEIKNVVKCKENDSRAERAKKFLRKIALKGLKNVKFLKNLRFEGGRPLVPPVVTPMIAIIEMVEYRVLRISTSNLLSYCFILLYHYCLSKALRRYFG